MWEMRIARPFGRLSIRKLLLLVAGLLATIFSIAFAATPVSAQSTPDAVWEGEQIVYDENTYTRDKTGEADDPRGVPEGAIVFSFNDSTGWPYKLHLIYFASNPDPNTTPTDVNTATQALYIDMTYTPPETYEDHSEPKTLNLEPYNDPAENTTSCNQEGIGWIICPLTNWLAKGMDTLYSLISGFLEVRPAQTTTENALYRVWSVMRNFANILFVIGFLVIIYSQITSFGVSNYHIKKMLPRLVIAAILVNVSYWICAIAIDVSNILGYSIQDIFMNVRENLVGEEGNNWELLNWQSITGAVLAAGAGATALTVAGISFVAGAGSSIFLLLPILVGVIMAVLVALLIMAARQAIITILLVISPLAFVAFLLPNTEKYFEKWRSLGLTMLMLFPIFSAIFGGAQLAGALIIQNADQINLVILGLAVQVAPLVITPFLIRFSGSLLGRIAGIINNPNKGVIDRTRKFAEERAGQMKSRQLAKGNNWLANRARGMDGRRRNREGWQKSHDAMTEANWANTSKAHDIHKLAMKAADVKEIGENNAAAAYHASKATSAEMQNLDIKARASKLDVDLSKAKIDANWEEFRAGDSRSMVVPENLSVQALASFAHGQNNKAKAISSLVTQSSAEARRTQSAQNVQTKQLAEAFEHSIDLQKYAGGIDRDGGAQRALADALTAQQKMRLQAVDNAKVVIDHKNLNDKQIVDLALGSNEFLEPTADTIEAAVKKIAASGNIEQINRLAEEMDMSAASDANHRIAFVEALKANGARPKYFGFGLMSQLAQGKDGGFSQSQFDEAIRSTIEEGKLSADVLVQQDKDAIDRILQAIKRDKSNYTPEALSKLTGEIDKAFNHNILSTRIGEREDGLKNILSEVAGNTGSYNRQP